MNSLYTNVKNKHPELEIPEGNLNTLGLQLIFDPSKAVEGVAVFEFALTLYPTSANLYDSLAEGYVYIGDTKKAKENFRKSLTLNPQNQNARMRIEQLKD